MKQIAFLMVAVVLLLVLTIAPANAVTPIPVAGAFVGTSYPVYGDIRYSGANVFTSTYVTGVYISGPMDGAYEQSTNIIWHFGNPQTVNNLPANPMSWMGIPSFAVWNIERTFTGTVYGKLGTLTMHLEAKFTYPTVTYPSLEGSWIIISGTGELADLHGQGTWWNSPGQVLQYEGQMHFD